MIRSLKIENYAIIKNVELSFDSKFNIITGETGAGKSILLGALGLILGKRADSKVLFDKKKKCVVEITFTNFPETINTILDHNEFDTDKELIIRREISASGKSRAFINDTPTKLDFLQNLSLELVDLNSQFQIRNVVKPEFQLNILDALAGNKKLKSEYQKHYSEYKLVKNQLDELKIAESESLKQLDYLQFQFDELTAAHIEKGEQKQLEQEKSLLDKAGTFKNLCHESEFEVSDKEGSIKEIINKLSVQWEKLEDLNPEAKHIKDKLIQLRFDLDDLIQNVNNLSSQAEENPQRLEEINERLDSFFLLQRKHGVQSNIELIQLKDDLGNQIKSQQDNSKLIATLTKQLETLEKHLAQKAKALSKKRKAVIPNFEKSVNQRLSELAMKFAEIQLDQSELSKFSKDGQDKIQFLFKSNKGADFLPIKDIASGGESSRLMLSIKSIVAEHMQLPSMIFDEIDTGISGEIAGKMADILKGLSASHQLICITHSPQVASRSTSHFMAYKIENNKSTETHVELLGKEERIIEIAKMLSGDPPSTFALDNARDLIKR